MPTYEFYCRSCRKRFEALQTIEAHVRKPAACPRCDSNKEVDRVLSTFYAKTSHKG